MKRLLMAGGGTGGHVYPLLAVLEVLSVAIEPVQVLYLGSKESIEERLARQAGVPFAAISADQVLGVAPWRLAANTAKLAAGVGQAKGIIGRFRPDVVLVTGGFVSVPVAVGARLARRPVVICLPDMRPGLAVRSLARLAEAVTVSFDEVRDTLPRGKAVVTGYPVRQALVHNSREAARRRLEWPADETVLVVFGGSRGSRAINDAVLAGLPGLLELARVVHITGTGEYERVQDQCRHSGTCTRERYRLYSYAEQEMPDLLWAADLVVARAGAATLGEFPAAGVPSILVPYPHAGGHQALNATYLYERGAAQVVADAQLHDRLLPAVRELFADPSALARMREAARALAKPRASQAVVAELQRAAGG